MRSATESVGLAVGEKSNRNDFFLYIIVYSQQFLSIHFWEKIAREGVGEIVSCSAEPVSSAGVGDDLMMFLRAMNCGTAGCVLELENEFQVDVSFDLGNELTYLVFVNFVPK